MKIIRKGDALIIKKRGTILWNVGLILLLMIVCGIWLTVGQFPLEEGKEAAGIAGVAFSSLFTLVVFSFFLSCLSEGFFHCSLDSVKICKNYGFIKRSIPWMQVRDWGLSYVGLALNGESRYVLYFSQTVCPLKNSREKKLMRATVRFYLVGDDAYRIIREVFPFCLGKTLTEPFVAQEFQSSP